MMKMRLIQDINCEQGEENQSCNNSYMNNSNLNLGQREVLHVTSI